MQEPWQSAFIDVFRRQGFAMLEAPVCSKDGLRLNLNSKIGRLVMRVEIEGPPLEEPCGVQRDALVPCRGRTLVTPRRR